MDLSDVKAELKSLVVSNPNEMKLSDLARDYQKMNGIPFPYQNYNCSSLEEFIKKECRDIFRFDDQIRNFVLSPVITKNIKNIKDLINRQKRTKNRNHTNKPKSYKPSNNQLSFNKKSIISSDKSQNQFHSNTGEDFPKNKNVYANTEIVKDHFNNFLDDDALPFISMEQVFCPGDCMKITDRIEKPKLLELNSYHEVFLAQVLDPSHFWFQIYSLDCGIALETLMENMNSYYINHPHAYMMPKEFLKVGQYCAIPYLNTFHRAVIIKEPQDKTIKVHFVDYGTVEDVPVRDIKFLLKEYSKLPVQAFRGRLAYAVPVSRRWCQAAINMFLEMVSEKRLYAKILNISENNKVYIVNLIDTSSETIDVHILDEIKNKGLAEIDKLASLTHECIEPSFDILEMGGKYIACDLHSPLNTSSYDRSSNSNSILDHSSECEISNFGINSYNKNINCNMNNLMSTLSIATKTPTNDKKISECCHETNKLDHFVNTPFNPNSNTDYKNNNNSVTLTLVEIADISHKKVEIWKIDKSDKAFFLVEQVAYMFVQNDREGFIEDMFSDSKKKIVIKNNLHDVTKNLIMYSFSGLSVGQTIQSDVISNVDNYKFNLLFLPFEQLVHIFLRYNSRIALTTRVYVPAIVKLVKKYHP